MENGLCRYCSGVLYKKAFYHVGNSFFHENLIFIIFSSLRKKMLLKKINEMLFFYNEGKRFMEESLSNNVKIVWWKALRCLINILAWIVWQNYSLPCDKATVFIQMINALNLCNIAVLVFIIIIIHIFVSNVPQRLTVFYCHAGIIFKAAAGVCPDGAIRYRTYKNHTGSGKYSK